MIRMEDKFSEDYYLNPSIPWQERWDAYNLKNTQHLLLDGVKRPCDFCDSLYLVEAKFAGNACFHCYACSELPEPPEWSADASVSD